MLLPSHHRSMRLAGVRQWSDFVCLFGLKLLGAQKNRLTAVNNFPCYDVISGQNRPMFKAVLF